MNLDFYKNRAENSRFSTQFLEYDEYVFDMIQDCFFRLNLNEKVEPPKGTLIISSYCILFCPNDVLLPVYKISYTDMKSSKISKSWSHVTGISKKTTCIKIKLSQVLKKMNYQPFVVETQSQEVYKSKGVILAVPSDMSDDTLEMIQKLNTAASTSSTNRESTLRQLIAACESKRRMNSQYILRQEKVKVSYLATLFCHFEKVRGFFTVTGETLYFIPHSTCKSEPVVQAIPRTSVKFVLKQRYLQTDLALEVFLYGSNSMFLVFDSQTARDNVYTNIGLTTSPDTLLKNQLESWQRGEISNFEYLMFLNQLAGRTKNDISLYPILPWLIIDQTSATLDLTRPELYRDLSKPIGALNEEKLATLKKASGGDENSLFHKYCSNPDDVASLIARSKPDTLLQLRYANRNNISPDIQPQSSLLMSVSDAYNKIMTDPKFNVEAVPDFFEGDGDLFINNKRWVVNGTIVPNMILPAWAKTTSDFIRINRRAIESDYVTDHISEWIDLVFGFKASPQSAPKYDNLYNRASYKLNDSQTFSNVFTNEQRELYLLGQSPKQLFTEAHPAKIPTHRTLQAQLVDEREALRKELNALKERLESKEAELKELHKKKDTLAANSKKVLTEREEEIALLTKQLEQANQEKDELRNNIDDMEKRTVTLTKEMMRMTPKKDKPAPAPEKKRPEDVQSVNRYVLRLEKQLADSKKDEKLREKELEQTHKSLLEYKNKWHAQKETSDKYYEKIIGMKHLTQQHSDLTISFNRLKLESEEQENKIHKLLMQQKERDIEMKNLKLENNILSQQVRAMEALLKDDFKASQQVKKIRYLEQTHGRIKTSFKEEKDIEVDPEVVDQLSTSARGLYEPVPLKSRLDNPSNLDESTRTVETSALLNESSQMLPDDFDQNNSVLGELDAVDQHNQSSSSDSSTLHENEIARKENEPSVEV